MSTVLGLEAQVPAAAYWRQCDHCGADHRVRPSDVRKALKRGNNPPRFCSTTCMHAAYVGEGNPKWRGGSYLSTAGYRYVLAPNHPHANSSGYVPEHRQLVERHIGRVLDPTECVHHVNHDKLDNRIENLELMASWSEHHREHHGARVVRECAECGGLTPARKRSDFKHARAYCSRRCAAAAGSRAAANKRRGPE